MGTSILGKAAILSSGLCLAGAATPAHAVIVNLLTNPSIDTVAVSTQIGATPTGWTVTSTKSTSGAFTDGGSSETFCNVSNTGGYGLFFKSFQGSLATTTPTVAPADLVTTTLYQDNTAVPGLVYTMTGYAGAGAGYIGLTDPTVKSEFHLIFLSATNTVLADNTYNLTANGLGSPSNPNLGVGFNYKNFSFSAGAPVGATTVRTEVLQGNSYANPAGGDQAFVADTFTLSVPEPTSLSCLGLAAAGLLRRRRLA